MAKKYEFKPDKPRISWLSKLHLTVLQRKAILKWSLYGLFLLVLSVLQDVILCRFRLHGATTELVPCAIFLICVISGTHHGSLFALISSALYLFSGTAPGPYSMVFITFLAIFTAITRQAFLQKGFGAALVCVSIAMLIYSLLNYAMALFLGLTILSHFTGALLTPAMTLPALVLLYPICTSIEALGGETWKE